MYLAGMSGVNLIEGRQGRCYGVDLLERDPAGAGCDAIKMKSILEEQKLKMTFHFILWDLCRVGMIA